MPSTNLKDVIFWSTIAFAFGGVESGSTMGEEIQDARRTVPRAVLTAGAAMTVLYIAGTLSVLLALPSGQISGLQGIMQAIQAIDVEAGIAVAGADRRGVRHAERARRRRRLVRGHRTSAVRRGHRSVSAAGLRRAASEVAHAVRRAARSGRNRGGVHLSRAGRHIGAGRVSGARQHGDHRLLHPVSVHVRGDDRAAARARRPRRHPRARRKTSGDRAGLARLLRDGGVDRAGVRSADKEPNKTLAVVKVVGLSLVLVGIGVAVYLSGRRRAMAAS